jgi:NAD(P) transhydrogenase
MHYDLLVIGNDQEGFRRAISAARIGRCVAVIIPAENSVSLDLIRIASESVARSSTVTMPALREKVRKLKQSQSVAQLAELERAGIEVISGEPQFVGDSSVEFIVDGIRTTMTALEIIVACGTKSRQPVSLPCDGQSVLVTESLLDLEQIPRSSIVVGAGTTGLMTAILLAKWGVDVTVVDEKNNLLDVCRAIEGAFAEVVSLPIAFRLGDEVIGTAVRSDRQVTARLASGRVLAADTIIVCVGRVGNTETLNVEAAGIGLDERGRIWCDRQWRTWSPQVIAIGDVVSNPYLS